MLDGNACLEAAQEFAMHPAAIAWQRFSGLHKCVEQIDVLKRQRKEGLKSGVYRLIFRNSHAGPSTVIAKRCRRQTALIERRIYLDILPAVRFPTLHCYGLGEESEDFCWLFLEDARGIPFSLTSAAHRALSARLFAEIHAVTRHFDLRATLPERGAEYYRRLAERARAGLLNGLESAEIRGSAAATLETLMNQVDTVLSTWGALAELLGSFPSMLCHGDIVPKNLRVRQEGTACDLMVFDWEMCGHGSAAPDIAQITRDELSEEARVYRSCARHCGYEVTSRDLTVLIRVGAVLRLVAAASWESESLYYPPVDRSIDNMGVYASMGARAVPELLACLA